MARFKSTVVVAVVALLSVGLFASLTSGETAGGRGPVPGEPVRASAVGPAAITPTLEQLYVPVTPCRIVDTRGGATFNNGTTRTYYASGTFGFAPQGGKSGGCGIPVGAKALTATFTAVTPSHAGFVRAWAAGGAEPQATLLNYATFNTGTGATVPVLSGGAPALTVKNYGGPTHLVIDVTGYYIPQLQAYISSTGGIIDQSGRLVSVTKGGAGVYTLVWDRDTGSCSAEATSDFGARHISVYTNPGSTSVYVYDTTGALTDYYFSIVVNC